MTIQTDEPRTHEAPAHPLVMRVTDNDFQCEVLEKLARLEAKMEMLVGSGTEQERYDGNQPQASFHVGYPGFLRLQLTSV